MDSLARWLAIGLVVTTGWVAGPNAGTAQEKLTLRISGENPLVGLDLQMAQRFIEILQEELGDDFEHEFFHTEALGDEVVHMQMIRTGQIDVYPMGSDAIQLDPKWAIFDMPFVFKDRDTVARLLDGEIGETLRQSMREAADLEVLAFGEIGFRQITNDVRPIVVPEDLEGLRLRVPGSKMRSLMFETYGATPVTMNLGELYLALQQGTVDGQENPLGNIKAFSWHEVQDYLSLSSHVYTPITLVMNGARWDGLSDEQKAAVQRAAEKAVAHSREYGANNDATLLDELSQSMQVNEIDLEAFQEAAKPIWDEIAPIAGEEFTQTVIAAVQS